MHLITLPQSALSTRSAAVRSLVQPLIIGPGPARGQSTVACRQVPSARQYILATHDGAQPDSHFRDWRFSTYLRDFRCMYFEVWVPVDETKRTWALHQSAFSLFRVVRSVRQETEILAIHCDPMEDDNAVHAQYKQGPHLHVSMATDPLPHAHFALNHGHIAEVMASIDSLSDALATSMTMVRDQVMDANWPMIA